MNQLVSFNDFDESIAGTYPITGVSCTDSEKGERAEKPRRRATGRDYIASKSETRTGHMLSDGEGR